MCIPLKLNEIKKSYETVYSLGYWCDTAGQLQGHGLRKFSGPFDWVLTTSLSYISRVIQSNFHNYMKFENLHFLGYSEISVDKDDTHHYHHKTYVLLDTFSNIISAHDFPVNENENENWPVAYEEFRKTLTRRLDRFINKIKNTESTLFVRMQATYEEAIEFRSVIRSITDKPFTILIVNPVEGISKMEETDWNLDQVVCVNVPIVSSFDFYKNLIKKVNQEDWTKILSGIQIKAQ